MNKKAKPAIKSGFALLLLAVFLSSLLIKPAHILFSHHEHVSEVIHNHENAQFATSHYEYCAILDYEFCTFIQHTKTELPQVNFRIFSDQTTHTVACLASTPSHLFQLRAPPALA
ncbi:MAG TPA: hypothetical protein P5084_12240 [Paludibacter sp.]|nr:hypothetical protein [Paludibacter sp.]